MKQYLTEAQSLELRSKKYPNRTHFIPQVPYDTKVPVFTYSVSDLLEFLPTTLNRGETITRGLTIRKFRKFWAVGYPPVLEIREKELVDALFSLVKTPLITSIYNGHIK